MNKVVLEEILRDHLKWSNGEEDGKRANLRSVNLGSADLEGAYLKGVNLRNADLRDANLKGVNLFGADLRSANLMGADLTNACMQDANLVGAYLRGANLEGVNLNGANLRSAGLRGADLRSANLTGTDLRHADLEGAYLEGANLWGSTGNLKHIKSIFLEQYHINYTSDILQIGCERHAITEWWEYDGERILNMDGESAMKFWCKWKDQIKRIIRMSPAEPTGYKVGA